MPYIELIILICVAWWLLGKLVNGLVILVCLSWVLLVKLANVLGFDISSRKPTLNL